MGYHTDFEGELKFNQELTGTQLALLNAFLGEDIRDHSDWPQSNDFYHIDLVMLEDFSGVTWDGSEKTYGMVETVNFLTSQMRKLKPDFCFTGELVAQGEEYDDRWKLVIDENGKAYKKEIIMDGHKVTCPHCEKDFILD